MSDLPQIPFSQMKGMRYEEFKRKGCFDILYDGEYFGTFVLPTTPYIREAVNELCVLGESARVPEEESDA